jgi:hypothetical protein
MTESIGTEGPDFKKKYFDLLAEVDKAWAAFPDGTHAPTLAEGIQSLVKDLEGLRSIAGACPPD